VFPPPLPIGPVRTVTWWPSHYDRGSSGQNLLLQCGMDAVLRSPEGALSGRNKSPVRAGTLSPVGSVSRGLATQVVLGNVFV